MRNCKFAAEPPVDSPIGTKAPCNSVPIKSAMARTFRRRSAFPSPFNHAFEVPVNMLLKSTMIMTKMDMAIISSNKVKPRRGKRDVLVSRNACMKSRFSRTFVRIRACRDRPGEIELHLNQVRNAPYRTKTLIDRLFNHAFKVRVWT